MIRGHVHNIKFQNGREPPIVNPDFDPYAVKVSGLHCFICVLAWEIHLWHLLRDWMSMSHAKVKVKEKKHLKTDDFKLCYCTTYYQAG